MLQIKDFFYSLPTRQNIYLHPDKVSNLTEILEEFTHHVKGKINEDNQNEYKSEFETDNIVEEKDKPQMKKTPNDEITQTNRNAKIDQRNINITLDEFLKDEI